MLLVSNEVAGDRVGGDGEVLGCRAVGGEPSLRLSGRKDGEDDEDDALTGGDAVDGDLAATDMQP